MFFLYIFIKIGAETAHSLKVWKWSFNGFMDKLSNTCLVFLHCEAMESFNWLKPMDSFRISDALEENNLVALSELTILWSCKHYHPVMKNFLK